MPPPIEVARAYVQKIRGQKCPSIGLCFFLPFLSLNIPSGCRLLLLFFFFGGTAQISPFFCLPLYTASVADKGGRRGVVPPSLPQNPPFQRISPAHKGRRADGQQEIEIFIYRLSPSLSFSPLILPRCNSSSDGEGEAGFIIGGRGNLFSSLSAARNIFLLLLSVEPSSAAPAIRKFSVFLPLLFLLFCLRMLLLSLSSSRGGIKGGGGGGGKVTATVI